MEVPRIWRERHAREQFVGHEVKNDEGLVVAFKYPGGEIPITGEVEDAYNRLRRKGFDQATTENILLLIFDGISAESTITLREAVEGFLQLEGSEVRK